MKTINVSHNLYDNIVSGRFLISNDIFPSIASKSFEADVEEIEYAEKFHLTSIVGTTTAAFVLQDGNNLAKIIPTDKTFLINYKIKDNWIWKDTNSAYEFFKICTSHISDDQLYDTLYTSHDISSGECLAIKNWFCQLNFCTKKEFSQLYEELDFRVKDVRLLILYLKGVDRGFLNEVTSHTATKGICTNHLYNMLNSDVTSTMKVETPLWVQTLNDIDKQMHNFKKEWADKQDEDEDEDEDEYDDEYDDEEDLEKESLYTQEENEMNNFHYNQTVNVSQKEFDDLTNHGKFFISNHDWHLNFNHSGPNVIYNLQNVKIQWGNNSIIGRFINKKANIYGDEHRYITIPKEEFAYQTDINGTIYETNSIYDLLRSYVRHTKVGGAYQSSVDIAKINNILKSFHNSLFLVNDELNKNYLINSLRDLIKLVQKTYDNDYILKITIGYLTAVNSDFFNTVKSHNHIIEYVENSLRKQLGLSHNNNIGLNVRTIYEIEEQLNLYNQAAKKENQSNLNPVQQKMVNEAIKNKKIAQMQQLKLSNEANKEKVDYIKVDGYIEPKDIPEKEIPTPKKHIEEATLALTRVSSFQLKELVLNIISSQVPSSSKSFIQSDFGKSFISYAIGLALQQSSNSTANIFAKELRVSAMTDIGTSVINEIIQTIIPVLEHSIKNDYQNNIPENSFIEDTSIEDSEKLKMALKVG